MTATGGVSGDTRHTTYRGTVIIHLYVRTWLRAGTLRLRLVTW
jgi:hypothetical protein